MPRVRRTTRVPSYGDAVLWLANNDETAEHDTETIATLTTTLLAADLWGVEPATLAHDIVRARHGMGRWRVAQVRQCVCLAGGTDLPRLP